GRFASRNCGLSTGDDPAAVSENRAGAVRELGLGPESLVTARQVHGANAVAVTTPWNPADAPAADAMVSATAGVALGVLTADCAPVLLVDPKARVVGCVHAGWRGALAGVTGAALRAMVGLGADPARVRAAIGPCIGADSYQVGPEFPAPFLAEDPGNERFFTSPGTDGRRRFDLGGYVAFRLVAEGVGSVEQTGADTCADGARFFSYRRATGEGGPDADGGRQISIIALAPA
ncbi:MAG: polyphenol oxidase family protein, partial [Proteobacteria bacterium]|nr:polyphenol oxidase family protein [Pseudomonadota bacterium]